MTAAAAANEDQSESRDVRADIVSATGELSDNHEVSGVGTVELEAEAEGDERADSVPAAGDLSDTHDVIIGVRAVELDTAEDQDVTGVKTYELDSPDGATAIDPRDHKEDIRIRSQKLLDSLIRGRKDCYICCQGLHDKSTAKSIDCDHEATAHFECLTDWFKVSII